MSFDRRTLIQTGPATPSTRGRTAPRLYSVEVLGEDVPPIAVGARVITVGAHATCDVVLADPTVSG